MPPPCSACARSFAGSRPIQHRAHRGLHRRHRGEFVQPDVAQRIGHRLVRCHVGAPAGAEQRGQRVIVAGREFQRIVAARLDHRLLDAEFALDLGARDQHGAQSGDQCAERLAQREHGRRWILRVRVLQAGAFEERREQRAVVGNRFRLRPAVAGAPGVGRPPGAGWRTGRRDGLGSGAGWPPAGGGATGGSSTVADYGRVQPVRRRLRAQTRLAAGVPAVRRRPAQSPPAGPCPSRPAADRRRELCRRNAAASGRPGRSDGTHPA